MEGNLNGKTYFLQLPLSLGYNKKKHLDFFDAAIKVITALESLKMKLKSNI